MMQFVRTKALWQMMKFVWMIRQQIYFCLMMHTCLMMRTGDQRGYFRLMMRTRDRRLNDQNHIEFDVLISVNDLVAYEFEML